MTADLVARLERCAEECDVYSPDVCGSLIEGIGHVAMRALLREAASALRSSGEAVAFRRRYDDGSYGGWYDATGEADLLHALHKNSAVEFAYAHPATPASVWRPIAEAPADFRDGTFIVTNRLGEVAPMVRGVIQNNVGSRDWTFGEPITEWQPLPPTSAKGG
jgi:hypothetical protein